jgi:hypothetical protein
LKQRLRKRERVKAGDSHKLKPPKRKWLADPLNKGQAYYKKEGTK